MHQASLLDTIPNQHDIATEPIPFRVDIAPELERVHIVMAKTSPLGEVTRFALPVQWDKYEASALIYEIRGVSWQLADLRARVREIRHAKKWLQEYRINARENESRLLVAYYSWLDQQEAKAIAMGKRIKEAS